MWSTPDHFKDVQIRQGDSYADVIRKFKKFLFSPASIRDYVDPNTEFFKTTLDFLLRESDRFTTDDIDFYIRFENIDKDIKSLCKNINIPPGDIPRFKSTQRKRSMHYVEYYDNIAKSVVGEKFKNYIEKFGYYF
tara:strand:- start:298 stop:702 length:405 start_codon:yes stop_codon:yes gene_type:complete